jgi:hypothetical protein
LTPRRERLGDIWVVFEVGRVAARVTSGPGVGPRAGGRLTARDRLLPDRSGSSILARRRADQALEQAERLTSSCCRRRANRSAHDASCPSRPTGAASLSPTTVSESRLTKDSAAEAWPAPSPDGARIAYVSIAAASRKLHVLTVDNGQDSTVLADARVERPTWSPAGDRLAWTATGARGAVYVSPLDGRYVNVASARHAESAWNPDGKTITLVDLPPTEPIAPVGYNGDPDRTGDREANLLSSVGGRMWTIAAPVSPDLGLVEQQGSPAADRAMHNADTFDQLWDRTAVLYYSSPDAAPRHAQWESLKAKYRPRAVAANGRRARIGVARPAARTSPYKQRNGPRRCRARIPRHGGRLEMLARRQRVDAAVARRSRSASWTRRERPEQLRPDAICKKVPRARLIESDPRAGSQSPPAHRCSRTGACGRPGPAVANAPGTMATMYLA